LSGISYLIHSSALLAQSVSCSVGITSSYSLLAFPLSVSLASTLRLLLSIHHEVVTVLDYS